jgi:DNA-binding MarR family transcriptional regulator
MPDEQYILGALLVIANKLDTILERELKEFEITSKQWFLSIIISSLFEKPPTIKEVAREMGSSHQNIKQVALKLQEKGLLSLEKDKRDARVTRLKMNENSDAFWERTQPKGAMFIEEFLKDIKKEDLTVTRSVIQKMMQNLTRMEEKNNEGMEEE